MEGRGGGEAQGVADPKKKKLPKAFDMYKSSDVSMYDFLSRQGSVVPFPTYIHMLALNRYSSIGMLWQQGLHT
jgi:hypothetical protein